MIEPIILAYVWIGWIIFLYGCNATLEMAISDQKCRSFGVFSKQKSICFGKSENLSQMAWMWPEVDIFNENWKFSVTNFWKTKTFPMFFTKRNGLKYTKLYFSITCTYFLMANIIKLMFGQSPSSRQLSSIHWKIVSLSFCNSLRSLWNRKPFLSCFWSWVLYWRIFITEVCLRTGDIDRSIEYLLFIISLM